MIISGRCMQPDESADDLTWREPIRGDEVQRQRSHGWRSHKPHLCLQMPEYSAVPSMTPRSLQPQSVILYEGTLCTHAPRVQILHVASSASFSKRVARDVDPLARQLAAADSWILSRYDHLTRGRASLPIPHDPSARCISKRAIVSFFRRH